MEPDTDDPTDVTTRVSETQSTTNYAELMTGKLFSQTTRSEVSTVIEGSLEEGSYEEK